MLSTNRVLQIASVVGVLLLSPLQALAHVALVSSMPGNGSVAKVAPTSVMLEFTENVKLLKATVTVMDGKDLDIGFKPSAKAEKHFMVALPALANGMYKVSWTVMGDDGHRMDDSLSFTIDPNASAEMEHAAGHGAAHDDDHGATHGDGAH